MIYNKIFVSVLLWLTTTGRIHSQYGDYYDYNQFPCYSNFEVDPTTFGKFLPNHSSTSCLTVPPVGIPCNNTIKGNGLYLVLDPHTNTLAIQLAPLCNSTNQTLPTTLKLPESLMDVPEQSTASPPNNSTNGITPGPNTNGIIPNSNTNGTIPDPHTNGTIPDPSTNSIFAGPDTNGKIPDPNASGAGTCTLISIITQVVQDILSLVIEHISSLLNSIIPLVKNTLSTALGPLLGGVSKTLDQQINNTLTKFSTEIGKLVNSTGGGLLGNTDLISNLLNTINQLLEGPLLINLAPQPLNNITTGVKHIVNHTMSGVPSELTNLMQNLLNTTEIQEALPGILSNMNTMVNNTSKAVLDNIVNTVIGQLKDLPGNSSLTRNLTISLETFWTSVLNNTCNIEKMLNDTGSLATVIDDVEELINNLLKDNLKGVGTLVDNFLKNLFGRNGILDYLVKNIINMVQKVMGDVLDKKIAIFNQSSLLDPSFKTNLLGNLTTELTNFLNEKLLGLDGMPGAPSVPAVHFPGVPMISGTPVGLPLSVNSVIPLILVPVENVLNQVLSTLGNLQQSLNISNPSMSPLVQSPVTGLPDFLSKLLQELLDSLLGMVRDMLGNQLGNITQNIDVPSLTSPLGTIVTDVLKGALECNLTCSGDTSGNTTQTLPTITPVTLRPFPLPSSPPSSSPTNPSTNPPINFPINTGPPPNCDPSYFIHLLQHYQNGVASKLGCSINSNCGPGGMNSLYSKILNSILPPEYGTNVYNDYGDLPSLPNGMTKKLEDILELTDNLVCSGLIRLIENTQQNSNSSDILPILPSVLP